MNSLSYFSNYTSKEVREKHPEDIAEEIHSDPFLKSQTLGYRSCGVQSVKQQCPLFAVACRFSGGKAMANVMSLTGLSLVDIDHVEPERMAELRALIVADPHTMLCYTTVSGCGLRIIFPYHLDESLPLHQQIANYTAVFQAGNEYYQQLLGVETDLQCKNVTRLSGLAHDPEVYYNPAALELKVESGEVRVESGKFLDKPSGKAERKVESFASRGSSANAQQGEATFNSPLSTSNSLIGSATPLVGEFSTLNSQLSTSNSDSICRRAHSIVERKECFVEGNRHNFLTKLIFLCSDYGVPEADTVAYLYQQYPDYRDESFPHLVASCYRSAAGTFGCKRADAEKWLSKRKASPKKGKDKENKARAEDKVGNTKNKERFEQIIGFLQQQPLRHDAISHKIQWQKPDGEGGLVWRELTDLLMNDLYIQCLRETDCNFTFPDFCHALLSSSIPTVHPLREYVLSLPRWEPGMPDYIGQVADMVTVAPTEDGTPIQPLWSECFRKWFTAMVAGWIKEREANHQVLVLIGEQGIYKTSWIEALMPPALACYCSKQAGNRFADKDEQLRATEFGLLNLDEIDRMTESELNTIKTLISTTFVIVRPPYGRHKETRTRIASYAASGNKENFLTDTTGNRRWLPFRVISILSPYDHPMPYEGMYAQARYLIHSNFNYRFSLDEIRRLAEYVNNFMAESREEQLLPVYFDRCSAGTPGAVLLTAAEISAKLTDYGNIKKPMPLNHLGRLLSRMGYVQRRLGIRG